MSVIVNDDCIVHLSCLVKGGENKLGVVGIAYIGFWSTKLELNNSNFGFFHTSGSTGRRDDILIENDAVDELCIFNCPSYSFYDAYVLEIHVSRSRGYKPCDGINRDWGKDGRILGYNLQEESANGYFFEGEVHFGIERRACGA